MQSETLRSQIQSVLRKRIAGIASGWRSRIPAAVDEILALLPLQPLGDSTDSGADDEISIMHLCPGCPGCRPSQEGAGSPKGSPMLKPSANVGTSNVGTPVEAPGDSLRESEEPGALELLHEAAEQLIWCSGSGDFGPGGQAELGWKRGPAGWLEKYKAFCAAPQTAKPSRSREAAEGSKSHSSHESHDEWLKREGIRGRALSTLPVPPQASTGPAQPAPGAPGDLLTAYLPNMCREGHQEIRYDHGEADSICPLCRAISEIRWYAEKLKAKGASTGRECWVRFMDYFDTGVEGHPAEVAALPHPRRPGWVRMVESPAPASPPASPAPLMTHVAADRDMGRATDPAPRGEEGDPSPSARDAKTRREELREALAELCHTQWSGWMEYLFGKCEILPNADRGELAVIPEWAVQRWKRQMSTPYAKLSDGEKDSDRKEADRFLALLQTAKPSRPEGEGPSPSSSPTPAPQGAEAAKWLEADLAEVNDRSRNQPSNCRECGGPRNWNGSKPPFCPRCLVSDWPIVEGHVFDYPAAARSIALNLAEFFHTEEPYPLAIANAARRARTQVKTLRSKVETLEAALRISETKAATLSASLSRANSEAMEAPAPASPCSHPNGTKYEHSVHGERICPDCLEIYPATKPAEITGQTLAQATGQLQSVIDAAFGAAPASPGGLDLEALWDAFRIGQIKDPRPDKQVFFEIVGRILAAAPPPRSLEARPLDVDFLTQVLGWMVAVDAFICETTPEWAKLGKKYADQLSRGIRAMEEAAARPLEEGSATRDAFYEGFSMATDRQVRGVESRNGWLDAWNISKAKNGSLEEGKGVGRGR